MAAADYFYAYGSGLALLALAGLVYLINRPRGTRRHAWWLIGFGFLQAMTEWSTLVWEPAESATASFLLRGLLGIFSLVALAEYGRSTSLPAKPTDGRWIYAPLAGLLVAAACGRSEWFCPGITVLLAIQGSLLIGKFMLQSLAKQQNYPLQTATALDALGFLLASVFDADVWKLLSLLTVLAALWIIDVRFRQARNDDSAQRRYGLPVGFCALLLAGAILCISKEQPLDRPSLQHERVAEISDSEKAAADAGPLWLQACCLALGPPVVLIAVAWGVSRLRRDTLRIGI